ncbi:unnamed protein product [Adineta steineri]|uniref:Uncharacterized protein n=1 Tax=Adineta steineri TaxID=433720 RepID=A0A813P4C7_9BILA|nr:unnamed protein product [Adineta steineri]CAF0862983.1 unnamed protein product [Adineta steineri]
MSLSCMNFIAFCYANNILEKNHLNTFAFKSLRSLINTENRHRREQINHQTRTTMAQNKDQLLEEQIAPLAGTAQNFLPNNGSPSNATEDASTRCSTFGTYAFCFFCIIAGFFIFAFALFLLPGRGRDSLHSTYGFRDGLIRSFTFMGVLVVGIIVFSLMCVGFMFAVKRFWFNDRTDSN